MVVMHWDKRYYINVRCYINVRNDYCLLMGSKLFLSKAPTSLAKVLTSEKVKLSPGSRKEPSWDLRFENRGWGGAGATT